MILIPMMSVLPVLFLFSSVSAQCLTANDSPMTGNPAAKTALPAADFHFALDTLKKMVTIEPKDNVFYSPHSLHQALSLVYFGARGNTEESLKKVLHLQNLSKVDVQRYYAFDNLNRLAAQENGSTDYEYESLNRLWISDTRKVRECMLDFFSDSLEKTDFHTNPEGVRENINQWVSNVTRGHIRDLLPAGSISVDTDLVLANAVYFKGLWRSRFDPANSKKDLFYSSGSQNSVVTFMHQKGTFNHLISELLGAHILELPYKGENISMFVLLPPFATARSANSDDHDGVRQMIEHISTEEGAAELQDILHYGVPPRDVEVYLPKFTMEKELPVHTLLSALGAGHLVTPNMADLRGFLEEGERPLHLGDAVHRARIEVTEEGTTAAAATALFTFRSGRPLQPAVFNANHPFVYLIFDKQRNSILFSGIYRSPNLPKNTAETSA
ncbi:serine protease inhibitor 88Ea isoform X2 [Nomia melanderi]|uniref:serine protease inhibitor 88Ea isoform X2 n=1 Tax=Nomia melanderi TaxID=2448451 RepID=UPI00130477FD|nr:serine protease inhibitor 88Ea-like isoform X2 [Nomia melanderi]